MIIVTLWTSTAIIGTMIEIIIMSLFIQTIENIFGDKREGPR